MATSFAAELERSLLGGSGEFNSGITTAFSFLSSPYHRDPKVEKPHILVLGINKLNATTSKQGISDGLFTGHII